MSKKSLLLVCCCVLTSVALCQEGSRAQTVAANFAARLDCSSAFRNVRTNANLKIWNGESQDCAIGVSLRNFEVTFWADDRVDNPPAGFHGVRSEDEAWRAGDAWAASAGIDLPSRGKAVKEVQEGEIVAYDLSYRDRPYGYFLLSGNLAELRVSVKSGRVIYLQRQTGFRYDPPKAAFPQEEAIDVVSSAVSRRYGGTPALRVVDSAYSASGTPGELGDPNQPNLWEGRRGRLVYRIEGELRVAEGLARVNAIVDAETGIILNGSVQSKSGKLTHSRKPSAGPTKTPATINRLPLAVLGIGGVACIVGFFVAFKYRRG